MAVPDFYAQIEAVGQAWPPLRDEPNLQDLHWLARVLMQRLALTLPDDFLPPERGVQLVELVERTLLLQSPAHHLRFNSPTELVGHCIVLLQEMRDQQLLPHDDATNLVAALFTWVGCLRMAKSLRVEDSARTPYTDDIRRREYATLAALWGGGGGPWIRYGATLAHPFEAVGRGNPVVDAWVPPDSPYWSGT